MTRIGVLILLAVNASLVLNVLALGMRARASDATFVLRQPRLLLRSLLAMNVIAPLVAAGLVAAFDLNPIVAVALIAIAVSPVPPMLPKRQSRAGGDAPYAIGLLVAAALLAIVVMPVAVWLLGWALGRQAHVPGGTIASLVISSVLAPLMIGLTIRRFAPRAAERLSHPLAIISVVLLAAGVVPFAFAWSEMMALVGSGTLVALAAFSIAALGVGHWLGGPEPEHRTVLALATATRHPAIAIAIATANIAEPSPVMAAVLLYLVVSVLVAIPYIKKHTDHGAGMGGPVTVREPLPTTAQPKTIRRAWG